MQYRTSIFDNLEIDKSKTKKNVKRFFMNDYIRLIEKVKYADIQNISYGIDKVNTSKINTTERNMINLTNAKYYLNIIDKIIESMDITEREIIKLHLIKGISITKLQSQLPYSQTSLYVRYDRACINFATTLRNVTDIDLLATK